MAVIVISYMSQGFGIAAKQVILSHIYDLIMVLSLKSENEKYILINPMFVEVLWSSGEVFGL